MFPAKGCLENQENEENKKQKMEKWKSEENGAWIFECGGDKESSMQRTSG